jgi:hypothetical protein
MKRVVQRWVCWAVAVLMVVGVESWGKKIRNDSFEDAETEADNPYGDIAAGWGRWGNWINRESGWKPTKSGKCLMGYHHWQIEEDADSGFYQDVEDVPAGSECTFTIYASRDKATNADAIELRLEKNGGFEVLATQVYPLSELQPGWQKLSITGKAPAEGGIRMVVVVRPKAEGTREGAIKFDDASLDVDKASNDGVAGSMASKTNG